MSTGSSRARPTISAGVIIGTKMASRWVMGAQQRIAERGAIFQSIDEIGLINGLGGWLMMNSEFCKQKSPPGFLEGRRRALGETGSTKRPGAARIITAA